MRTAIALLIFLSSLLIGISCKKDREVANYDGDYTITGKVLDEITGAGIAGANVGVIERGRDATSNLGGKTVAFDKSDAEGNFTLTFYVNSKNNTYDLSASALSYFERTDGGDAISFTKNESKTQNAYLMPHGYLTFLIKGNKGGNEIRLSAGEGGGGISFYQEVDTFRTYYTRPTKESRSAYWVFYDDTSRNYNELVILPPPPPHDTTYYLIEF